MSPPDHFYECPRCHTLDTDVHDEVILYNDAGAARMWYEFYCLKCGLYYERTDDGEGSA